MFRQLNIFVASVDALDHLSYIPTTLTVPDPKARNIAQQLFQQNSA